MIQQTEVDGVPTLIAPTTGPWRAGLVFRVGFADETLVNHGITHLLEHLALHRHGLVDYHYNGTTTTLVTHFVAQGDEAELVAFLTGVCESLTELPIERLEVEKEILRTEATRSGGPGRPLPLWRHGARGYGLSAYPEWGLSRVGPDQIRDWSRQWFTRGNAMLWIAGDGIPAGLKLRLPDGERRAFPEPTSALPATPAFYSAGEGAVLADAIVSRGAATSVATGVLQRELFRSLRQEGGYSYAVAVENEALGADRTRIAAFADAQPAKQDAVLGGFIDALARLRVGTFDPGDVPSVVAKTLEELDTPTAEAQRLPVAAAGILLGYPLRQQDDLRAGYAGVGASDVQRVFEEFWDGALLQVPDGHRANWAGFEPAPTQSSSAVEGPSYQRLDGGGARLVVGMTGISLVAENRPATVSFDACAAVLAWPDGARMFIGNDGISVHYEPTLWHVDRGSLLPFLDAQTPRHLVVPMPARAESAIPQSKPPAANPPPTPAVPRPRWIDKSTAVVLIIFLGLGALFFVGMASESTGLELAIWGTVVVACLVTIFAIWRASPWRRRAK